MAGVVGTLFDAIGDEPPMVDVRAGLALSECDRAGAGLYRLEARLEVRALAAGETGELVLGGRLLAAGLGKTL